MTDELRAELHARTRDLDVSQKIVRDLDAERSIIARELADFARDLNIQRRECAKFASELGSLRSAQLAKDSGYAKNIASLQQELALAREDCRATDEQAREANDRHAALSRELATLESSLRDSTSEQRQKFKLQTRRLSAQIEYLKAKYTRENTFRNALALQKKFLLLLVGGMSLT